MNSVRRSVFPEVISSKFETILKSGCASIGGKGHVILLGMGGAFSSGVELYPF
jgi:hypothetical protein